jgi:23S rRNA G2445 N2-methylase RlmL
MLGTYYRLQKKTGKDFSPYKGQGKEYNACMKVSITKELYEAFVKEARDKYKAWKESVAYNKKNFRKCRKCGASKRIGKPCVICEEIKKHEKKK